PATTATFFAVVPQIRDRTLSQVSQEGDQFGMVLLVLAVLTVAAVGNPMKRRAPVGFDDRPPDVRLGGWVAKVGEGALDVLRRHAMVVTQHAPASSVPYGLYPSLVRAWRVTARCARLVQVPQPL